MLPLVLALPALAEPRLCLAEEEHPPDPGIPAASTRFYVESGHLARVEYLRAGTVRAEARYRWADGRLVGTENVEPGNDGACAIAWDRAGHPATIACTGAPYPQTTTYEWAVKPAGTGARRVLPPDLVDLARFPAWSGLQGTVTRTRVATNSGRAETKDVFVLDAAGRLTGAKLAYDAEGRLVTAGTTTIAWTGDRPTSSSGTFPGGGTRRQDFVYDARGRLVTRTWTQSDGRGGWEPAWTATYTWTCDDLSWDAAARFFGPIEGLLLGG